MWSSLGIRQKVFALLTVIALTPLVIVNIIWLRSSQAQLKQAAASRQSILLSSSAQRVNESLDAKINSVVAHSQDQSVIALNTDLAKINLMQFANQDSDVSRIALIDNAGNEQIVINNHEFSKTLSNVKSSDAFKVVTQISNTVSVSEVAYDNGQPKITISVPLLSVSKLGDQNLTDAQALARRYGADIKGALIVDVSLSNLWKSILSAKLGTDGYVYLVNEKGNVIAYRDQKFIDTHPNLLGTSEVNNAVKVLGSSDLETAAANYKPTPSVTNSEAGVQVLSSSYPISRTRWAIIGEEPISSVYSASQKVAVVALVIFLISVPVSIGLVLLATRNIIMPIRQLTDGAVRMGAGDFGHHLIVKGTDELAIMAKTFNKMGDDLQSLIDRYRLQNLDLLAERAKLQAVLDTIADGVVVLDHNFKIVLANKTITSLTLQTDPKLLYGLPWLEAFHLNYGGKTFENRLLNGELLYFHDMTLQLRELQKYVDITAIHLHEDPNGMAYILTVHDITQRRELENMKLDFVSMAAHELRTPVTAIRGYLGLLAIDDKSTLSETSKLSLERAQSSSIELVGLISNLLNVSKIERGTLNMNYGKVDWAKTVQDTMHDHDFNAAAKHIEFRYDGPAEGIPLLVDEVAIKEVINNLVANALNYTNNNGHITVSVRVEGDNVITSVKDDGVGIPPDAMEHLFTKFFRVKGGLASGSGGTGLGLFISKSIIELHKGTISVESEYGEGSTFTISLPAFDAIQYQDMVSKQEAGVNKRRGWVTKNTAR